MIQNVTGLQNFTALRPNIFEGTPAVTTILNDDFQVQCCKNGTGKRSKPAAIGRWSPVNATEGYYEDRSWPLSFVPKWILGVSCFPQGSCMSYFSLWIVY